MIKNNQYVVDRLYTDIVTTDVIDKDETIIIYNNSSGGGLTGGEVNQNAFSFVTLPSGTITTLAAISKTDTLKISGVSPINITIDENRNLIFSLDNISPTVHQHTNMDALNLLSVVDGKLQITGDVYSTGELSAYGIGTGSGGSVTELKQLVDVVDTLTPVDKDVLYFDSSLGMWTTIASSSLQTDLGSIQTDLNAITSKVPNWDLAYTNAHTHANKTILDSITNSSIPAMGHLFLSGTGTVEDPYYLYTDVEFYSKKGISAYGVGKGGSGGSGLIVYGYNNLGGVFLDSDYTDTFNAYTINKLASRITTLEGGTSSNISISTIGTGNAITTATKSGDVITFAKDSTFVLTNDYRLTNARYNPYALTFSGYSTLSYDGYTAVTIPIPNDTSQLTNGAGYITSSGSITGNAATATALKQSRYIWGQSFSGLSDVYGDLSNVDNLIMSGVLNIGSAQFVYDSTNNTIRVQKSDGSAIGFYSTGEVSSYGVGSNNGTAYISKALSLSSTLTTASDIYSGGNIHLNNEFYIKCKNTSGTYYQLFGVDSANYVKYGDSGLTSIFKGAGVLMSTASKTNIITLYDTITLNANTAVTGTITSTGSGTFTGGSFSSLRSLKNVHEDWTGNALLEISKFKVRDFNYNGRLNYDRTLGLIVDEIPESIGDYILMGKNRDSVNLYSLHAVSILAHQEEKIRIEQLEQEVLELKQKINQLEIIK